jgi:hypothetical protein
MAGLLTTFVYRLPVQKQWQNSKLNKDQSCGYSRGISPRFPFNPDITGTGQRCKYKMNLDISIAFFSTSYFLILLRFMKHQNLLQIALFAAMFCCFKLNAQTVYIAETGKKYHVKNCPAVKTGRKAIELKEARKKGYEPCTECGADKIVEREEKSHDRKK